MGDKRLLCPDIRCFDDWCSTHALINLTLGENEAANAVLGGLKTPKASVLWLDFVCLMGAAIILRVNRCIGIAIRILGCASSSLTLGQVAMRVFGLGRCKRCAGNSEKTRKRDRDGDLRNHGHSSL